jgi:hypothetical protein
LKQDSNNSPSNNSANISTLYNNYYECLAKSAFKSKLNQYIKEYLKSPESQQSLVDQCVLSYTSDLKVGSAEYKSLSLKSLSL